MALAAFCHSFAADDSPGRSRIRNSTSLDEFYTLLSFSERAAVFAMRDRREEHILDGLTAVAIIETSRIDYRDAFVALNLLDHAAREIGANSDILFEKTASLAEPQMSRIMLEYIKQPAIDRDIRTSSGYTMIQNNAGSGFLRWNFESYQPTFALDRIALAIAELVRRDIYQPTSVTLASTLPAVWLRSGDDTILNKALTSVRAGASINAELRPQESPDYEFQRLWIFLAELNDESAAGALLRLSEETNSTLNKFVRIGVKEGRLFCVIVARAIVAGKVGFETPASMQRFSTGIARVLKDFVQE